MLTPKQTPLAVIGILAALGLADGEPEKGKLIIALAIVAATVTYVLVCTRLNGKNNG